AAVGAGLLTGFVAVERRVPEPMLPPGLFAGRGFTVAVTVGFCLNVSFFGQLFVLSLFFQRTLGLDAWDAGLALAPQACSAVVAAPFGGRAAARFGAFPAMLTGLVLGAAGFAGTAFIGPGTAPLVVSGVTFAAGFGMAFAMPAATAAAVSAVPDELAGTAGGVVNAARQTGSVVGVAILGGVVAADASPSGFRVALLLAAGIFIAAATLVAAAARDPA
ncbi:MFS transporter, partial [Arachnia propionica]|uniref:MFS transporter n=1 Tax=Arachnia propionica TaxID=1750 RepID=UPI002432404E